MEQEKKLEKGNLRKRELNPPLPEREPGIAGIAGSVLQEFYRDAAGPAAAFASPEKSPARLGRRKRIHPQLWKTGIKRFAGSPRRRSGGMELIFPCSKGSLGSKCG